jgi:hypothetical protein
MPIFHRRNFFFLVSEPLPKIPDFRYCGFRCIRVTFQCGYCVDQDRRTQYCVHALVLAGAAMLLATVGYDPMALSTIVARTGLAVKNRAADWTENPFLHLDFEKRHEHLLGFLQAHPSIRGSIRNEARFRKWVQ